jgi:hypothetical protein
MNNNPMDDNDDRNPTVPGNVLINGIMDTIKEILADEAISREIDTLNEKIGVTATDSVLNIMVASAVHSIFKSITIYDTLLKDELIAQFDKYGNILNNLGADTDVLKIKFRSWEKKLEDTRWEDEIRSKIAKYLDESVLSKYKMLEGQIDALRVMVECEELNDLSTRVSEIEVNITYINNEFAALQKKINIIRSTLS